jgi:S1-C subfamily serine protease
MRIERATRLATWGSMAATVWTLLATPSAVADSLGTIQRVKPSILAVGTYQSARSPRFQFRGTGFIVENGTLVVTNAHVIPNVIEAEKREVLVVAVPGKGQEAEVRQVTVLATDRRYDLSILKLQGTPLPALKLGDSGSVVEGERYLFTGFPIGAAIGLFPATHHCIISALTPVAIPLPDSSQLDARTVRQLNAGAYSIFQLDGTAYPGNSGSPLYDPDTGEVVGIVNMVFVKGSKEAAITAPSGITYAIPVQPLKDLLRTVQ